MQKLIAAADGLNIAQCLSLVSKVGTRMYAIKIHDLYDKGGSVVVSRLRSDGAERVWVDAKLHDIPKTVENRTRALISAGANIITVHASGGTEMMKAAVEVASTKGVEIYAITILTSLSEKECQKIYGEIPSIMALQLALMAKDAGVQGIVCSPHEVKQLSDHSDLRNLGLKFVVPGIRSVGTNTNDQKRFDTPAATIKAGATHLVIGRQITQAQDPKSALDAIEQEISPI